MTYYIIMNKNYIVQGYFICMVLINFYGGREGHCYGRLTTRYVAVAAIGPHELRN